VLLFYNNQVEAKVLKKMQAGDRNLLFLLNFTVFNIETQITDNQWI